MKKTPTKPATPPAIPAEPAPCTCKNGLLPDGAYCPSCTQGNIRKRLAESKLAAPAAAPFGNAGAQNYSKAQPKQTTPPAAAPVSAAPPPEAAPALDPLRGVQNFHDLEEKQPKEAKALR